MPLPVQFGMLLPHRLCLFPRAFDLDQRALADSRTILGRLRPCPRVVHQLEPEWENPALGRLRRMDPAAAIVQKGAVRAPRHAQPHTVARAVYILTLESSRTHPGEPGRTHQVRLRQVDKPLLLAAFRTSWLALEPHPLRHRIIMICNASAVCDIFASCLSGGLCMSCVRDIVHQRELFSVEENQSVAEVARKMTDLHVGAILVFHQEIRHFPGNFRYGLMLFDREKHQSVAEVARKMTDLHVGAVLVFNRDQLRGVFSERDLMKRVVVERRDPERTPVGLVMSTGMFTIDESGSLEEAMESMQSNNCRHQ